MNTAPITDAIRTALTAWEEALDTLRIEVRALDANGQKVGAVRFGFEADSETLRRLGEEGRVDTSGSYLLARLSNTIEETTNRVAHRLAYQVKHGQNAGVSVPTIVSTEWSVLPE